jgi:hypothetical protein
VFALKKLAVGRIIDRGIGPFSSRFLRAVTDRECMRCGGNVAEMSLLTNSIVVTPGRVVLHCITCRGGRPLTVQGSERGWMNTNGMIAALNDHTCHRSGERLDWLEALTCVRYNYAHFQSLFDPRHAFVKPTYFSRHPGSLQYERLLEDGNCPECGARWGHAHDTKPTTTCWHCRTPNSLHWHIRTTEGQERQWLLDAA